MAGGTGYVTIDFDVAGIQMPQRRLVTGAHNVSDLSRGWEQVGEDLLEDNALNFIAEGKLYTKEDRMVYDRGTGRFRKSKNPRSTYWAALAPSTVSDRVRHGYPGPTPILWRTGDLARSVTERGASGNVFRVRPDGVEVGSAHRLAAFHQYGTVNMPARPIVGLTRDRQAAIVKRLNAEVLRQLAAAGLR